MKYLDFSPAKCIRIVTGIRYGVIEVAGKVFSRL